MKSKIIKGLTIMTLAATLLIPGLSFASVPSVSISASRTEIDRGVTITLTWNSTNALFCRAPWTGSVLTSGVQVVNPIETTTYNITCTGDSGSNSASVTVNINGTTGITGINTGVNIVIPGISLTANPVSLQSSGLTTLSWNSSNASFCSSGWSGIVSTFGSLVIRPTQTTTYTISCVGPGGSNSASVTVWVYNNPGTVVTITNTNQIGAGLVANINRVVSGAAVNLFWDTVNADRCFAPWTSNTAPSGQATVYPSVTTTYAITCFRGERSISANQTVTIIPRLNNGGAVSRPISRTGSVFLVASPNLIKEGTFSILRWNSSNTENCEAITPENWTKSMGVSGEQIVYPREATTYVIKCSGKSFNDFAYASVVTEKNIENNNSLDKDVSASLVSKFSITKLFFALIIFIIILVSVLWILRKKMM